MSSARHRSATRYDRGAASMQDQPSMAWLQPVTLRSPSVNLEPLDHRHCDDLIEAVKDGTLWTLWYTPIPRPEDMTAEIDRRLILQAAGSMLPFAVIDNTTGQPARGDRLDLVSQARPTHAAQHAVQAAAACARLRDAELHRRRVPNAYLQ